MLLRLRSSEHPAKNHARYYLEFAARRAADLRSPRQPKSLEELAAERENLRAVLDWAAQTQRVDLLTPTLKTLMSYFDLRGGYREAEHLLTRLSNLPEDDLLTA